MKKKIIKICLISMVFLLIGNVYASDFENESENTTMKTSDLNMSYKDGSTFKVNLECEDNVNKIVNMTINDVTYPIKTNQKGEAELPIGLSVGDYIITTSYENMINKNKIQVNVANTNIECFDELDLGYRTGEYQIALKNDKNLPISNAPIIFNINNVNYKQITNNEGIASMRIGLNYGTYQIKTIFNGNNNYKSSSHVSTLNIVNKKYKFIANDYEMEYKNGTFNFKLIDEYNKAVPNSYIESEINGAKYTLKSDKYGNIELPIGLNPGNYQINYKFENAVGSSKITVKTTTYLLKTIDMNTTYNDYSYFTMELTKNGKNIGEQLIKTDIYKDEALIAHLITKTYDNGLGKFLINLDSGKYIFKSYCDEYNYKTNIVENIVIINPANITATSKDLTLNRKGEYYTVSLKNNNTGLGIINEKVAITINGKTYYVLTDENGEAKLRIGLGNGIYPITYEFEGTQNYNKITGSNTLTIKNGAIASNLELLTTEITRRGDYLVARLSDLNSIAIANEEVNFNINGVNYLLKTDNNGIAKLRIGLNDGKYKVQLNYLGNELFNQKEINEIVNINKTSDFSYSFNISTSQVFKDKKLPLFRYIDINYNSQLFNFITDSSEEGIVLEKDMTTFLSFDYNTVRYLNNPNNSQGIGITATDDQLIFTYYGKLTDINRFNVVFDEYNDKFFGKIATISLNDKIEAKIMISEEYYNEEDIDILFNNGYDFESKTDNVQTKLYAFNTTHEKMLQLSNFNNYKTVESYVMTNCKIQPDYIQNNLNKYMKNDLDYDKTALENSIISLNTIYNSQQLDDVLAENLNCSWREDVIVLTTSDWNGINIHSTYKIDVNGTEPTVWTFKNTHGIFFAYCEQLALESLGIEATSATSEILNEFENNASLIFNKKGEELRISAVNSTSEIVINMTSGNTQCLLGLNISQCLDNFKYKGANSKNFYGNSFEREIMKGSNIITSSLKKHFNNIISSKNRDLIERYTLNEIRTNKNKVLGGIQSILTFLSPTVGGFAFGSLTAMINIGEYSVDKRNKYASDNNYQYFSYHPPVWDGKTITVTNSNDGYIDYVEIPYKSNGDLDMSRAIYIDGETGKRNLTQEEIEYYGNL